MCHTEVNLLKTGDKVYWCNRVHVYLCKHPTEHSIHYLKREKSDAAFPAHFIDIKEIK